MRSERVGRIKGCAKCTMRMGRAEPGMLEIVGTLSACSSQLVLRMAMEP